MNTLLFADNVKCDMANREEQPKRTSEYSFWISTMNLLHLILFNDPDESIWKNVRDIVLRYWQRKVKFFVL